MADSKLLNDISVPNTGPEKQEMTQNNQSHREQPGQKRSHDLMIANIGPNISSDTGSLEEGKDIKFNSVEYITQEMELNDRKKIEEWHHNSMSRKANQNGSKTQIHAECPTPQTQVINDQKEVVPSAKKLKTVASSCFSANSLFSSVSCTSNQQSALELSKFKIGFSSEIMEFFSKNGLKTKSGFMFSLTLKNVTPQLFRDGHR